MSPHKAAAILAWCAVAIPASLFGPWAAAKIEAEISPVLDQHEISEVRFDQDALCWDWRWRKRKPAAPVMFRYYIETRSSGPIPVVVVRPNSGPVTPIERAPGITKARFCAPLPSGITHDTPLTVTGIAEYSMPHGLWLVRQPLPVVEWSGR
jgi:hypothetical protein